MRIAKFAQYLGTYPGYGHNISKDLIKEALLLQSQSLEINFAALILFQAIPATGGDGDQGVNIQRLLTIQLCYRLLAEFRVRCKREGSKPYARGQRL